MKYLLLALVFFTTTAVTQIEKAKICSCSQVDTQTYCLSLKGCYWYDAKCQSKQLTITGYCESKTKDVCAKTEGCALVDEICSNFAGCQAYNRKTDALCQAISKECTSNGTKCIPWDSCPQYKNEVSCVKDSSGKYCYWDKELVKCKVPTKCTELPVTLLKDSDCRDQISTCTVNSAGGCVDSGEKCSDQKSEGACVYNKTKSQACFWNKAACVDKLCENALDTLLTNDDCKLFMATCTVAASGKGCMTRPAKCLENTIESQCFTNSAGDRCVWNVNKCEDPSCNNAPITLVSESDCVKYISTCTIKMDSKGCMTRPQACSEYLAQVQCTTNAKGGLCFWNSTLCVERTCANASVTLKTDEQCDLYSSKCTLQTNLAGCVDRQATCANYVEQQCYKKLDGSYCKFINGKCVDRTCDNAPETLASSAQCSEFDKTCVAKPTLKGCTLKTCAALLSKDVCSTDYLSANCYWGVSCQVRTCDNAPTTYVTDAECRSYLSICTVKASNAGCMVREATCDKLTTVGQCTSLNVVSAKCSWNIATSKCRDINCEDAPVTINTHDGCQQFLSTCTISATLTGCITKMTICTGLPENQCQFVLLSTGQKCSYNTTDKVCRQRVCKDASNSYTTDSDCRNYLSSCTVTANGFGCEDEQSTCMKYSAQSQCVQVAGTSTMCGWGGCESRTCLNAPTLESFYTHALCNTYLSGCTVGPSGKGCTDAITSCNDLPQAQCPLVMLVDQSKCFWDTTPEKPACRIRKCSDLLLLTATTHATCNAELTTCTTGPGAVACITQMANCDGMNQAQCEKVVLINGSLCSFQSPSGCRPRNCLDAMPYTNYKVHSDCAAFLSSCTVNDTNFGCVARTTSCDGITKDRCNRIALVNNSLCSWGGTPELCRARVCDDYIATDNTYTDQICKLFLPTCTVKTNENGCQAEAAGCSSYTKQFQCQYHSVEKQCVWNTSTNSCRVATCSDAPKTYTTHTACAAYISSCTLGNGGGCVTVMQTCTGLPLAQCDQVKLLGGGNCSWSGTACRSRECSDAPDTNTTDAACRLWKTSCTVQLDNTGCTNEPTTCQLTQSPKQCQILSTGIKCGWNQGCVNRFCSNAPATLNSDTGCRNYFSTCTVSDTGTGCIVRGATCAELTTEKQCVALNSFSKYCQWNSTKKGCEDRSCTNAPETNTTDAACKSFLATCTVKTGGTGCITRTALCSGFTALNQCFSNFSGGSCQWTGTLCTDVLNQCTSYLVKEQCTKTLTNQKCIWLNNECVDRTCTNAPQTYTTTTDCNDFQAGCITNGQGCIDTIPCASQIYAACSTGIDGVCTKVETCGIVTCDKAPLTYISDQECISFKSTCTTNGQGCVERNKCQNAYVKAACVTNRDKAPCAWVEGTTTGSGQCVDITCSTAPGTLVTEDACIQYYPSGNCTTKLSGGCVRKSQCIDVKVQAGCTTAIDGTICSWIDDGCRNKSCADYFGPSHALCNKQDVKCTTNGQRCTEIKTCNGTSLQAACIIGTDGPCIWVNNACYLFRSCYDMLYTTDVQCKQFNSNCTTNGRNCVPITSCAETPKIGCYKGTDGTCIWTPVNIKISSGSICKVYVNCTDAFYLTHNDCYSYSQQKCTTDLKNGCIDLAKCSEYADQGNCYQNKDGKITKVVDTLTVITSTGGCKWDTTTSKCRDIICSDLVGTSHETCYSQLSSCSFDGVKCIVQTACISYMSSFTCFSANGTDGKCIWDKSCRKMQCTDVPTTMCQLFDVTCVQDGTRCVTKGKCTEYLTQAACDLGGSDGSVCSWAILTSTKGKCSTVTNCSEATIYQSACEKLKSKCVWLKTEKDAKITYSCATRTCENSTDQCSGYDNWDGTQYTVCQKNTTACTAVEPTELTQSNCFIASLNTYIWNASTAKCTMCTTPTTPTDPTPTNPTNPDGSGHGVMVALYLWAIIFMQ